MKNSFHILTTIIIFAFSLTSFAQTTEATGYDGDNFSLHGALELFKEATSIEDFERKLNTVDNDVNNLDLNQDGEIDYIRVEDKTEDKVHAIVLQVQMSKDDIQDVAIIELEQTGDESANVQIVGNEEVYGEMTVVEPYEMATTNDGPNGPSADVHIEVIFINVWNWPCVRYVYRPYYRVYVSPWGWHMRPRWYRSWRPMSWNMWYPRHHHYYSYYRHTHNHRMVRAHNVYRPYHRNSTKVVTRTTKVRSTRRGKASVRNTNTRTNANTTVRGPRTTTTTTTRTSKQNPVRSSKVRKSPSTTTKQNPVRGTKSTTKVRTKTVKRAPNTRPSTRRGANTKTRTSTTTKRTSPSKSYNKKRSKTKRSKARSNTPSRSKTTRTKTTTRTPSKRSRGRR